LYGARRMGRALLVPLLNTAYHIGWFSCLSFT
jgi:hypothetical protein